MMQLRNSHTKTMVIAALCAVMTGCASTQQSNVSVDFYNISGDSTAALDREIKRKGPRISGGRHAVAIARIKMIPNVEFEVNGAKCRVSQAKVAVDAKVTLPKWTGRRQANKKLGQAWDNIDRYTRLHEAMHVAIAFRFAREIEAKLLALKPTRECASIRKASKQLIDEKLDEHDKTQKQFDADEQARFSILARNRRAETKI